MGKNVAVILSGSGVFDGSEIHEAVITLLMLRTQQNLPCLVHEQRVV